MLDYAGYCEEIVGHTDALAGLLTGHDLAVQVPTCPGWTLGKLARHVGHGHRWAAEAVRGEGNMPRTDRKMHELDGYDDRPDELARWIRDGARDLVEALRDVGPNMRVWTPIPAGKKTPEFFARHFTFETLVHRLDAALAVGETVEIPHELAVDAVDEWFELTEVAWPRRDVERRRALHGPDTTVHFHATDTHAEWVVDLTGEDFTWRHAHEKSTVALRAAVQDLLLVLYRRRAVPADAEVFGDTALLASFVEVGGFG